MTPDASGPAGAGDRWSLAYGFPHDDLFAWAVGAVILGLLAYRFYVVRRRGLGR